MIPHGGCAIQIDREVGSDEQEVTRGLIMFVGRDHELSQLKKVYGSDEFETVVVNGDQQGVGVTSLLNHFIRGKKAVYWAGVAGDLQLNLKNLNNSILAYGAKAGKAVKFVKKAGQSNTLPFASIAEALEQVFAWAEEERLILVLDDYNLIAEAEKHIPEILEELSHKYMFGQLMLILCNVPLTHYYKHNMMFYGHGSTGISLRPFYFDEARGFLSRFSAEDKALTYGILGGKPCYLKQFSAKLSIEKNIKNTFLKPNSFLFTEPLNFVRKEFAEPQIYIDILTAIAQGVSCLKDIAARVDQESRVCNGCIKKLISLGLV